MVWYRLPPPQDGLVQVGIGLGGFGQVGKAGVSPRVRVERLVYSNARYIASSWVSSL
jgi:hypothetical protein